MEATRKPGQAPQFVKAGGAAANTDEISLDDVDDDDEEVAVPQKVVPDAVFGGITAESTLGAKARFQAKNQ